MGKIRKTPKKGNTGGAHQRTIARPGRKQNAVPARAGRERTDRLHLTGLEVGKLIDAATENSRNKERDRCLLFLMYRHGFRVSEVCGLPLDHVDVESRVLHVKRLKRGLSTTHPLRADEIRAINAWLKLRAR